MMFNLPSVAFIFLAGLFIGFTVMVYLYRDYQK